MSKPPIYFVPGDATSISIPAHAEALLAAGPAFLTQAFHAFGSLPADNRVAAITACEAFGGGNSGHKLRLSLAYERPAPGLDSALFVKFSRDFDDAFRDRRRYELEAEVHLAELSRHPAFPVTVARPYFADFHHESGTGLLIMQQIAFGQGDIEPLHPKCMDHELADPLPYYRATITALARLAAAHKSGRLSPEADRLFPTDVEAVAADLPIPWDEAGLRAAVSRLGEFAKSCPQILPASVTAPGFITRLEEDAVAFLRHEEEVRRFLAGNPDFLALAHWNTNIDNAWFWRDEAGALQCGLLDWGMVRVMHVTRALWGGLSAAEMAMLNAHLDELLALFATELAAQGGPKLDLAELGLHFDLALAMTGLALMMDLPVLVLSRLPAAARASGLHDPLLREDPVVHGFHHVTANFLNLWATRDFGASLKRMLERSAAASRLR